MRLNKQQILEIAITMAKKDGLINLTANDLCRVAEIPAGSFQMVMGLKFSELIEQIKFLCPESNAPHFRLTRSHGSQEHRRTEILRTAMELATQNGYRSIQPSSLAEEAGISRALLHSYFGTKEQLLRAVMRFAVANRVLPVIAQGIANREPQALKAPMDVRLEALALLAEIN